MIYWRPAGRVDAAAHSNPSQPPNPLRLQKGREPLKILNCYRVTVWNRPGGETEVPSQFNKPSGPDQFMKLCARHLMVRRTHNDPGFLPPTASISQPPCVSHQRFRPYCSNDRLMFSITSLRLSAGAKGLYGGICFPLDRDRAIQSHQRSSRLVPLVVRLASAKA